MRGRNETVFFLHPSILFVILFFWPLAVQAEETMHLAPFTSDGCSAFPDGTLAQNELWLECCTAHDYAYWKGGTYAERLKADLELKACVEQVGEPEIAKLMLAGVRVGGSAFFPTPFRWGYGWSSLRGYQALTAEELRLIEAVEKLSAKFSTEMQ